jgi:recombination protein RecA
MTAVAEKLRAPAFHPADARATLEVLRAALPAPLPPLSGLSTGIAELDDVLAVGGLPRGRLTEVVGASGKLTLLREIVNAAVGRGDWVAYVDASRTLAPRDWAHLAHVPGVWMLRPPEPSRAAWCADVLLRSAAFALVILDSAPPISRAIAVRLTGLARESNAAFVVVGASGASRLSGATRLHVHRRRQRLRVAIEKGAKVVMPALAGRSSSRLQHVVEVSCASGVARRLCSHSEVPDRRGAARSSGTRGRGRARAATPSLVAAGGMLQHC